MNDDVVMPDAVWTDEAEETGTPVRYGYTPSTRISGYFAVIGPSPACTPGDTATALAYLHKIDRALLLDWSEYESNRLRKLQAKWAKRAFGKDARFNLVGTRSGRLKAEVEYKLRLTKKPKQPTARKSRHGTSRVSRQREVEAQQKAWENADMPHGRAKGAGASVDPDNDVFEVEAGEVELPNIPAARQYLIPGQDTKGHAHRVYCRVMPAHYRALCALERSKQFGFRTLGDVIRWCIDLGVRELTTRARVPQAMSALAQVDAIREVLLDEQYYLEFPTLFEQMTTTINRHLSAGAEGEAVRLIAIVRNQIEQMGEEYWREKYMDELMRHYGSYLDGSRAASASVEFGGG